MPPLSVASKYHYRTAESNPNADIPSSMGGNRAKKKKIMAKLQGKHLLPQTYATCTTLFAFELHVVLLDVRMPSRGYLPRLQGISRRIGEEKSVGIFGDSLSRNDARIRIAFSLK